MELAYNLLVSAFIAILLSYLVAKLIPLAVSGGEVSGGKGSDSGVDNGDKQKGPIGGVEEGNLEKKLKVKGSKSKKKRSKKISAETVVVSEFKRISEPPVSAKILGGLSEAADFGGDCEHLGSLEKEFVFSEARVEEDDYFGLNGPLKLEGGLIEGLDLATNQGSDLEKLIDSNERRYCESDVISGNEGGEMEISDGEEWEGIERNELEKDFARALNYVECVKKEGRLNKIGSDVIMQFHDLQKVAMEGPFQEPKISARAKWNSWQKSESLNPEEAMEKFITLLSNKVPGWMESHPSVESKLILEKDDTFRSSYTALNIPLRVPLACTNQGKSGEKPVTGTGYLDGRSSSLNKDGE